MICKKPFRAGALVFGCGQCLPCRINRGRLWTHRLMLETLSHPQSSFITLTYAKEPPGGSLVPKDAQDFLKRLRKHFPPKAIRYYLVGEYGDQTMRPHYHAAIFGSGPCLFYPGPTQLDSIARRDCKCKQCELIRVTWGLGHTDCGTLTKDSAQYICGYVTKKMTRNKDDRQKAYLKGRHPEFARMSLKPGIGALSVRNIIDAYTSEAGANELIRTGDVPMSLRHGKRIMPLGRYMRRKLREFYGFEEIGTPKEALSKMSEEMLKMLEDALDDPKNKKKKISDIYQEIFGVNKQSILNIEAKHEIFKKKGML